MHIRNTLIQFVVVLGILGLACKKDSPTGGDLVTHDSEPVTLANAFPGDEGSSWSYEIEAELWRDTLNPAAIYDEAEQVPDALTLDEVIAHASAVGDLPVIDSDTGTLDWSVEFALATGDTLSWLMEGDVEWAGEGRSLASLNAVMDRLGGHPSNLIDSYDYYRPLFIGNPHVWRCASWLGYPASYMVDEFPFLNGDLEPGDETSLELSAGIYLHFRVLEERRTITPAAAFNNALRIFYYFEHPVTAFYDIYDPEPIGYLRSLDYGTIDWVAGVGPVHSTYRAMVLVGPAIDEGMGMSSAVLTDATNLTSE